MRVVVITQDEPFYLAGVLDILFRQIRGKHEVVGCVLLKASPFGKKESAWRKVKRTYGVFGLRFFVALRATICCLQTLCSKRSHRSFQNEWCVDYHLGEVDKR